MNTKWLYGATQYLPVPEFSVMYDSKMLLESRAGERLTYYTNTYTKMRNRKDAQKIIKAISILVQRLTNVDTEMQQCLDGCSLLGSC